MISRKRLIIAGISAAGAMTLTAKAMGGRVKTGMIQKKTDPAAAIVVWYSQTGNTERVGRAIASELTLAGLKVHSGDYRDIDIKQIDKYDLIIAGTPVFYYEVPENFRKWINELPPLDGKAVAAFVTFGGEGGNQHNTVCELTGLLAHRGGVPAGTAEFSCMSSYALTWSSGNVARVLKYRDRPGAETYRGARGFAREVLAEIKTGAAADVSGNFSLRNIIKGGPSISGTKLFISGHRVNLEKCISCGRCTRACTVSAINLEKGEVDTGRCIACLGCINNCPTGAVEMKFIGKEVYGYREFIKRNSITPSEP